MRVIRNNPSQNILFVCHIRRIPIANNSGRRLVRNIHGIDAHNKELALESTNMAGNDQTGSDDHYRGVHSHDRNIHGGHDANLQQKR